MQVTIVGAGPAGLATSINLKRRFQADIRILERGVRGETPGLGVALLRFGLEELRMLELAGLTAFADQCFPIGSTVEVFAGIHGKDETARQTRRQDTEYWGVKRSALLGFLSKGAEEAGSAIEYGQDISEDVVRAEREAVDLLVGADGAGSVVRSAFTDRFKPSSEDAAFRFAWLELDGGLDHFLFGYVYVEDLGLVRITAYPHGKNEASAIVMHSVGLTDYFDRSAMRGDDGFISEAGIDELNAILSSGLGGLRLAGSSKWRTFRATRCAVAAFDNVALVGDAYTNIQYETGWGTSTALQASRIFSHILQFAQSKGQSIAESLDLHSRKYAGISEDLAKTTLKTMRELDAQAALFRELGPAEFLKVGTP